jgi:uncharacterized repeat protein (TIGR01451 family)
MSIIRTARKSVRIVSLVSLAVGLVAITSMPSMVSAAPAKRYLLAVSPATATVGVPTTFTVTMTNVTPPGTNSNPSSFYVTVPFPISGGITLPETDLEALAGSTNGENLSATVEVDPSNPSRILVKSLDSVQKNEFVKLTFTATPASCTGSPYNWIGSGDSLVKVTNGASLNGDSFAPSSTNVTTSVSCGPPALSVTKTADATGVAKGDTIGYTIEVTNSGGESATGVTLTDTLPTDAGLNWSIDSANSSPGFSITDGVLGFGPADLAAGASVHVHITSPTSTETVADSPVVNTATITATNVTPNPASAEASVTVSTVFTDAITCDESVAGPNEPGTPLMTLVRLDNADGSPCDPIPINLDSSSGGEQVCDTGQNATQCILLEKDLLGQEEAQFMWTVTWTPEEGEYPVHPTEFDFPNDEEGFRPLQRCLADNDVEGDPGFGLPELPSADPWCVVNSESILDIESGLVTVTETYYGKGDPTGRR